MNLLFFTNFIFFRSRATRHVRYEGLPRDLIRGCIAVVFFRAAWSTLVKICLWFRHATYCVEKPFSDVLAMSGKYQWLIFRQNCNKDDVSRREKFPILDKRENLNSKTIAFCWGSNPVLCAAVDCCGIVRRGRHGTSWVVQRSLSIRLTDSAELRSSGGATHPLTVGSD